MLFASSQAVNRACPSPESFLEPFPAAALCPEAPEDSLVCAGPLAAAAVEGAAEGAPADAGRS